MTVTGKNTIILALHNQDYILLIKYEQDWSFNRNTCLFCSVTVKFPVTTAALPVSLWVLL